MLPSPGQTLDQLDSPQLLLDLDTRDANLGHLLDACRRRRVDLRVHFKSLKCGGLARYLARAGAPSFLCAKLNEAEVLADAGLTEQDVARRIAEWTAVLDERAEGSVAEAVEERP